MFEYEGKNYRFPVEACGRCGGSGRYSYNSIDGDRCYGCGGTGVRYVKGAVAKVAAAYDAALKARHHTVVSGLEVGDKVLTDMAYQSYGEPVWVEVTAIVRTDEACGWSGAERVATSWYHVVSTDDGQERQVSGNQLVRRRVTNGERRAMLAEYQAQLPRKYREV